MTTSIDYDNTTRPIVGIDPDEEMTPEQLLDDGDYAATDSLMRWVREPGNEHYMLDIFSERNATPHRDAAIKQWAKQVKAGEWQ